MQVAKFHRVPSQHADYFREQCDFDVPGEASVTAGIFSMPSVRNLREHANRITSDIKVDKNSIIASDSESRSSIITVRNIIGEARSLHTSDEITKKGDRAPVIIQAASQFNLLEFPSPDVVPESGIKNYVNDATQGPACAIACAAGTAYRHYLVPVTLTEPLPNTGEEQYDKHNRGQTKQRQLNGLADVEEYLVRESNLQQPPWDVKNGYIESTKARLDPLNQLISNSTSTANDGNGNDVDSINCLDFREEMIARIRIGLQENTAVTDDNTHPYTTTVTQTYNSAISIGYSMLGSKIWTPLSQIVLDATYEATLLAGIIHIKSGAPPPIVFLTQVGGGVFGNEWIWIRSAMARAIQRVEKYNVPLDIRIVHFGEIDERYMELET